MGSVLDVRSPGEYAHAHWPGALNLPLFTDAERAEVGTCYKQQGQRAAIKLGLQRVGSKLAEFVAAAEALPAPLSLYCWRGGMRSGSMAWLLSTAGLDVAVLEGGYKRYRAEVRRALTEDGRLLVLGGYTGSAKTRILNRMAERGAQVIDLEGLAGHKGSAFGNLADDDQPSAEQFANLLWDRLRQMDRNLPIWIEDESASIGRIWQPDDWYRRIRSSPVIALERSRLERAAFLARDYGTATPEQLVRAFNAISKRLGGARLKQALALIDAGDLRAAADVALDYYDKTYAYGLSKRDPAMVVRLDAVGMSDAAIADTLIENQQGWLP